MASDGLPPNPFTFRLSATTPQRSTRSGTVRYADSTLFKVSTPIAAALETIRPGGLREMHWHPNADEWQYWIKGSGRMTVFDAGPRAQTMDFHAGDLAVVKRNQGHYIQNMDTTDLQPPAMVQTLNIDRSVLQKFPQKISGLSPSGRGCQDMAEGGIRDGE